MCCGVEITQIKSRKGKGMEWGKLKDVAELVSCDPRTAKAWLKARNISPSNISADKSKRPILRYDLAAVRQELCILQAEGKSPSAYVKRSTHGKTVYGKKARELAAELRE